MMASRILFQRAFGTSSARLNVAVAGGAPLTASRPVGALRGGWVYFLSFICSCFLELVIMDS